MYCMQSHKLHNNLKAFDTSKKQYLTWLISLGHHSNLKINDRKENQVEHFKLN